MRGTVPRRSLTSADARRSHGRPGWAARARGARWEGSSPSASFPNAAVRRHAPASGERVSRHGFCRQRLVRLAQLVRARSEISGVAGSSPASPTGLAERPWGSTPHGFKHPPLVRKPGDHPPPPRTPARAARCPASQREGMGDRPGRPVVGRIPALHSATPLRRAPGTLAFLVERGEPRATRRAPSAHCGASSPTPQPDAGVEVAWDSSGLHLPSCVRGSQGSCWFLGSVGSLDSSFGERSV